MAFKIYNSSKLNESSASTSVTGSGGDSIKITGSCDIHYGGQSRTVGTIKVHPLYDTEINSKTITITQKSAPAIISKTNDENTPFMKPEVDPISVSARNSDLVSTTAELSFYTNVSAIKISQKAFTDCYNNTRAAVTANAYRKSENTKYSQDDTGTNYNPITVQSVKVTNEELEDSETITGSNGTYNLSSSECYLGNSELSKVTIIYNVPINNDDADVYSALTITPTLYTNLSTGGRTSFDIYFKLSGNTYNISVDGEDIELDYNNTEAPNNTFTVTGGPWVAEFV